MTSPSLRPLIYDWLAARYPEGPAWNRQDFHCFRDCPQIVRSVVAMDAVEAEIANGAWGQLLWNTFPNWRVVLELAKDGYASMAATAQIQAIASLYSKLAEHEQSCYDAMQRAAQGNFEVEFGKFTAMGYKDSAFTAQSAFLDDGLESTRERWLENNRKVILDAIAA